MKTLLIGDMGRIDELFQWLECSTEYFEVELILSENELQSKYFNCPVEPLSALENCEGGYDIVFVCSSLYQKIKTILLAVGMDEDKIVSEQYVCRYLSKGEVTIENDVWIASGSKILSGVHIGNGSVIGANAVVTKDVEPYSVVGGNPAKIIKKRFDKETIKRLEEIQWWNWEKRYIFDAIPILQSNDIGRLFKYYDSIVKWGEEA